MYIQIQQVEIDAYVGYCFEGPFLNNLNFFSFFTLQSSWARAITQQLTASKNMGNWNERRNSCSYLEKFCCVVSKQQNKTQNILHFHTPKVASACIARWFMEEIVHHCRIVIIIVNYNATFKFLFSLASLCC